MDKNRQLDLMLKLLIVEASPVRRRDGVRSAEQAERAMQPGKPARAAQRRT